MVGNFSESSSNFFSALQTRDPLPIGKFGGTPPRPLKCCCGASLLHNTHIEPFKAVCGLTPTPTWIPELGPCFPQGPSQRRNLEAPPAAWTGTPHHLQSARIGAFDSSDNQTYQASHHLQGDLLHHQLRPAKVFTMEGLLFNVNNGYNMTSPPSSTIPQR